MTRFSLTAVAALLLATATAQAHEYKVGDLMIDHPWAFETAQTAQAGGGYMTITNMGETADRLIAVEADYPRVEVHTTDMDGDVARMRHLEDGLEIPAGETVTLEQGGLHVMFMGLRGDPFEVGEEVPATLVFENAGRIEVMFKIEERKAGQGMGHDHSGHDHGDHDHGDHDHGDS